MRPFLTFFAALSLCVFGVAACAVEEEPEGEAPAREEAGAARASKPALMAPEEAGARSVAEQLEDASVAARVKMALADAPALRPFDFEPEVIGGRAVLYGDVRTPNQRVRAAAVAEGVEGVRAVENRLTVNGEPFVPAAAEEAAGGAAPSAAQPAPGAVYHTVRSGESLWLIARRNDTTVRRLKQLNGLRSDKVKPGERLRVR